MIPDPLGKTFSVRTRLGLFALMSDGRTLATALMQNELPGDPDSFWVSHLQQWLPALTTHSQFFAMLYLFSHGIIKLFLAVGLLRHKLWAYPSAIIVFTLFIFYQIYLYAVTPSLLLVFLTIFDIIIIALTWHEYRYFKKTRSFLTKNDACPDSRWFFPIISDLLDNNDLHLSV